MPTTGSDRSWIGLRSNGAKRSCDSASVTSLEPSKGTVSSGRLENHTPGPGSRLPSRHVTSATGIFAASKSSEAPFGIVVGERTSLITRGGGCVAGVVVPVAVFTIRKPATVPVTATVASTALATPVISSLRRARRSADAGAEAEMGISLTKRARNSRTARSSTSLRIDLTPEVATQGCHPAGHQRPDGAGPATQDIGDLSFGEILVVAQDQRGTLS